MTTPKHVFLSYSQEDREWAREFVNDLREQGLDVWFDDTNMSSGDHWVEATEKALRESDLLIALISRASAKKPNVLFEIGAALGGGKRLVPVYLSDPEDAKVPFLKNIERISAKSPRKAAEAVASSL